MSFDKKTFRTFAAVTKIITVMQTATAPIPTAPRTAKKRAESADKYLFTRDETKELLGEYAFSVIDEAKKSGKDLDDVLDRLDAENVDTETFEDAALGRMMEEALKSPRVSREQVMKSLRRR